MSELRQRRTTREWFVIATERAKRPQDFGKERPVREEMERSEKCPFCPGNEHLAPEPTYVLNLDGEWLVRSVPNKFSAFSPVGDTQRTKQGVYQWMNGVGIHEVIVESPLHNDNFLTLPPEQIQEVIKCYKNRFLQSLEDPRIEAVIIFKNYGTTAGSSLAHPHSQMIAMPLVPAPMRFHLESAKRYFDDTGDCAYCDMMKQEMKEGTRVIIENDSFVVFCPYASGLPFETWIVPKRHDPTFEGINDREIVDLSHIMKDLFTRYYYGLNDPDFNYVIKTPPRDESNDRSFHWYIEVVPRLTKLAGFEIGTGMLINVTLPENNAKFLREIKVEKDLTRSFKGGALEVKTQKLGVG